MYKFLVFSSVWMVLMISCTPRSVKVTDDYKPKYTASQLQTKLKKSFASHSNDSLLAFLKEWNSLIPAAGDKYINQNDTLKIFMPYMRICISRIILGIVAPKHHTKLVMNMF